MSFIFIYLIVEQFIYGKGTFINLIVLFLVICFSDLLDGKIARKTGFVSTIGAKLDVFTDLLYCTLTLNCIIKKRATFCDSPNWTFLVEKVIFIY